jgi:intermembrane space import and assembly protein 40
MSDQTQTTTVSTVADGEVPAPGSPEALEEEASEQGAFNEETGEINWDCPCLGGMAYGPCGEQFRAAFSCFVFSQEEPKGVDCIEHFKTMQNCFREHPDVYGAELEDDDEEGTAEAIEGETAPVPSEPTPQTSVARNEAASLSNDKTSQQPLVSSPSPTAAVSAKPEQRDLSTAKADEDKRGASTEGMA